MDINKITSFVLYQTKKWRSFVLQGCSRKSWKCRNKFLKAISLKMLSIPDSIGEQVTRPRVSEFMSHDGSMGRKVDMPTWMVHFYRNNVAKSTSCMDLSWDIDMMSRQTLEELMNQSLWCWNVETWNSHDNKLRPIVSMVILGMSQKIRSKSTWNGSFG